MCKPWGSVAAPLAAALGNLQRGVAESCGDAGYSEAAVAVGSMYLAVELNLPNATLEHAHAQELAAQGLTKPKELSLYFYANLGPASMRHLLARRLCALFPAAQKAYTEMFRALGKGRDQLSPS